MYVFIGIIILVIFTTIVGMRAYFRWTSVQYFGEVIEIKDNGFVIKTAGGSTMLVVTNQNTDIRKGRKPWIEALQTGDFVIVVGSTDQGNFVEARVIRIVVPPRHPL